MDEFNLDWANVTWHGATEAADKSSATRQGLSLDYVVTKNDREGHDRANEFSCASVCKGTVERNADGKLVFASFCPVHLLLHAKTLQARDAGVAVDALRGPVWGKYRLIHQLPSGSTLVASDTQSVAHRAKALVMVVTRAQEAAGMFYDRSIPFIVNGRAYTPPCAGVYFEVPGTGYAVHAWADSKCAFVGLSECRGRALYIRYISSYPSYPELLGGTFRLVGAVPVSCLARDLSAGV